jgi:membrane associated rhomboid family serine protease
MQTERTFLDEMKHQLRHGGMHIRLIFINLVVFLVIGLGFVGEKLAGDQSGQVQKVFMDIFTLQSNFSGLIYKPWGLITSIFAHFGFIHFLVNMMVLYFAGRLFLQFFSSRRLLHLYIIGGIAGGLFEILAHELFPVFQGQAAIVGASGSNMAIMISIVAHRPKLQAGFFGIQFPLFLIPGLYLLGDLMSLGSNDGIAHFAHLGGALLGFLSVVNLHTSSNIINMSESFGQKFMAFFNRLLKPKQKMRVERGGVRMGKSDEQYNVEAKERQKKIDAILDKISKSGYESLTKAEKEFLFSQSKNG